jgi:hypothetical protein
MNYTSELEKLSAPFRALIGNESLMYQVYDLFPIPLEVFTPDGKCIFANRARLEMSKDGTASTKDAYSLPVRDGDSLAYTVVFQIKCYNM